MIDQRVGERFCMLRLAVWCLVVMGDEARWVPFEEHVAEVKYDVHAASIGDL